MKRSQVGGMEGALLRPRTRDGNQSARKLLESADAIAALYKQ